MLIGLRPWSSIVSQRRGVVVGRQQGDFAADELGVSPRARAAVEAAPSERRPPGGYGRRPPPPVGVPRVVAGRASQVALREHPVSTLTPHRMLTQSLSLSLHARRQLMPIAPARPPECPDEPGASTAPGPPALHPASELVGPAPTPRCEPTNVSSACPLTVTAYDSGFVLRRHCGLVTACRNPPHMPDTAPFNARRGRLRTGVGAANAIASGGGGWPVPAQTGPVRPAPGAASKFRL